MLYLEAPGYTGLDVTAGQSVELSCNTSLSADIMWTYDTSDGYVEYVFWNGHIASDRTRLSVKSTAEDFHTLLISDAMQKDSGLYNCYDGEGQRKSGHQLVGM